MSGPAWPSCLRYWVRYESTNSDRHLLPEPLSLPLDTLLFVPLADPSSVLMCSMLGLGGIQHGWVRPGRTSPARLYGCAPALATARQRDQLPSRPVQKQGHCPTEEEKVGALGDGFSCGSGIGGVAGAWKSTERRADGRMEVRVALFRLLRG